MISTFSGSLLAGLVSLAFAAPAPATITLNVGVISEPSSYAMMAAGLALVGFAARRRRQREAGTVA